MAPKTTFTLVVAFVAMVVVAGEICMRWGKTTDKGEKLSVHSCLFLIPLLSYVDVVAKTVVFGVS